MKLHFKKILAIYTALFICLFSNQALALSLGDAAPGFKLAAADGAQYSLDSFKGKTVVLEWYNRDCPFVRKHYDSKNMQQLQKKYVAKDIVWLTIISSAKGKQGYADQKAAAEDIKREKMGATTVLLDPMGEVGRLYNAKTTPHMYVVNAAGTLVYEGAIDSVASADKADIEGAKNYVAEALEDVIAGREVANAKTKAYGCSVKYN